MISPKRDRAWSGKVTDYGNFVFEFQTILPGFGLFGNFGEMLSDFIEDNPELELVSTATRPDGYYYVVFKKKQK